VTRERYELAALCIGGERGIAAVIERIASSRHSERPTDDQSSTHVRRPGLPFVRGSYVRRSTTATGRASAPVTISLDDLATFHPIHRTLLRMSEVQRVLLLSTRADRP